MFWTGHPVLEGVLWQAVRAGTVNNHISVSGCILVEVTQCWRETCGRQAGLDISKYPHTKINRAETIYPNVQRLSVRA